MVVVGGLEPNHPFAYKANAQPLSYTTICKPITYTENIIFINPDYYSVYL